ncbi:MAG: helix-turn-helix domain-containing protein [Kangiellaceae bacterium]|nr:helix-turn-helix domain-containing protein [Kangiellaceae bacterium]MCW9000685.1 helix-turn-helix domain-containing protein [Kangiellaceae bacterium]
MIMLLDKKKVKFERQQRAWSQAQLAESSGMSLRTVQRIEKDGKASFESAKSLAAVFCIPVNQLYLLELENGERVGVDKMSLPPIRFLSSKAKTLSATLFLLISLLFLFLSSLKFVSVLAAIPCALILSILIGLVFDAIGNEGLFRYAKTYFQSQRFSMKKSIQQLAEFSKKPLLITGFVVAVTGTFVYLNMEDYQKSRFSNFFTRLL